MSETAAALRAFSKPISVSVSEPIPEPIPEPIAAPTPETIPEPIPELIPPQASLPAEPPETPAKTIPPAIPPQVSPKERPSTPAERSPDGGLVGPTAPVLSRAKDPRYSDLARKLLSQLPKNRSATVLLTSPGDGEGKSSTLAPLGVALADQTPEEILLVDANFRNPTLAGLLGIESGDGLVDVLTGAAKWQDVVRKTGVDHVSVLPGGRFPSADGTPPEALDLAPLLTELSRSFRLVAFDAASLSHPEVAPMSRFFDATYLLLELGETSRRTARQAVRVIDDCGGRLLGCVLRVPPDAAD